MAHLHADEILHYQRDGWVLAGVALRYMPASSLFDRRLKPLDGQTGVAVNFAQRPLWLVRGQDRAGNDFVTGHAR